MLIPSNQAVIWQVVRFGVVGVIATLVHASSGIAAVLILELNGLQANVLGFLIAWWVSFFGHHRFTFRAEADQQRALGRFVLHSVIMFGIAMGVTYIVSVGVPTLPQSFLPIVGALIVPVISFFSSKFFVFKAS